MLTRLRDTIGELQQCPPTIPEKLLDEYLAFLGWLADDHFIFLGARDYVFDNKGEGRLDADIDSGIGLLTNPETRVIRRGEDRSSLTPDVRDFLTSPNPLIINKIEYALDRPPTRPHGLYWRKALRQRWRFNRRTQVCRPIHIQRL